MAVTHRTPFKVSARAFYNASALTTFSAMAPQQTTAYTIFPMPRVFRPFAPTRMYFSLGLPAGIINNGVNITGTALGGYTATFSLYNETSSTITPAAQQLVIWQED